MIQGYLQTLRIQKELPAKEALALQKLAHLEAANKQPRTKLRQTNQQSATKKFLIFWVRREASQGVKRVDLICPGFTSDCLETLEEISQEAQQAYLHAGGEEFHYIPCLNDSNAWVEGMYELSKSHMGGWPLNAAVNDHLTTSRREALAIGAQN